MKRERESTAGQRILSFFCFRSVLQGYWPLSLGYEILYHLAHSLLTPFCAHHQIHCSSVVCSISRFDDSSVLSSFYRRCNNVLFLLPLFFTDHKEEDNNSSWSSVAFCAHMLPHKLIQSFILIMWLPRIIYLFTLLWGNYMSVFYISSDIYR